MKKVLILATRPDRPAAITEAARLFNERGYVVEVATRHEPDAWDDLGVDAVHWLWEDAEGYEPQWYREFQGLPRGEQMWRLVERDRWTLRRAEESRAFIALDNGMVYPVWMLARRHPGALARYGLYPALHALDEMPAIGSGGADTACTPGRPDEVLPVARRRFVSAVRPAVHRWARAAIDLLPRRGKVSNDRVGRALGAFDRVVERKGRARAERLASRVDRRLSEPVERADLWGGLVARDLARGSRPTHLSTAAGAELDYADSLLARARTESAAGSFLQATRLLFHRAAHMDSTSSPLSEDPEGYVGPLHANKAWQRLAEPKGRVRPAAVPPDGRPKRVLIVTNGNTNFVGVLHEALVSNSDVEVRALEPRDLEFARRWTRNLWRTVRSELSGDGKVRAAAESDLREHLDWADVVFADWCTGMTRYLTLADPGTARIVVRLHSYEAWTVWPQLVDFSRVDHVVFVSEHLRELTERVAPALREGQSKLWTIPNAMNLERFALPKRDHARFTVAVLGFHVVAKDVLWAVAVVRELRKRDPRYRLKLIGAEMADHGTPAFVRYRDEVSAELDLLEQEGALVTTGRTADVPAALTDAGVILSSSVREGSPQAVLEGAASGAVPVVRDWPFFARLRHGARTMYPADWVVDSVDEAVERIEKTTGDLGTWRTISHRVSQEAIRDWHVDATLAKYEAVLFGRQRERTETA